LIARNSTQPVLCEVSTGRFHAKQVGQRVATGSLQFDPVGNVLAVAVVGGVEFWDVHMGKLRAFLPGLGSGVGQLAFSPDGRLLIAVSYEQRSIQLWDARRDNPLFALPLPPIDVAVHAEQWRIAASPDGKQIACSIWDSTHVGGVYLYSALPSDAAARETPSLAFDESASSGRD
jgi:WD40 repeat protein